MSLSQLVHFSTIHTLIGFSRLLNITTSIYNPMSSSLPLRGIEVHLNFLGGLLFFYKGETHIPLIPTLHYSSPFVFYPRSDHHLKTFLLLPLSLRQFSFLLKKIYILSILFT